RMRGLAVGERRAKHVLAALLLAEPVGARDVDHQRDLPVVDVGSERVRDGCLEDPGEDLHVVALDELARLRQALVRLVAARALGEELDPPPAGPAAGLAPVEEVAVAHVDPELRERPRGGKAEADLHWRPRRAPAARA